LDTVYSSAWKKIYIAVLVLGPHYQVPTLSKVVTFVSVDLCDLILIFDFYFLYVCDYNDDDVDDRE